MNLWHLIAAARDAILWAAGLALAVVVVVMAMLHVFEGGLR